MQPPRSIETGRAPRSPARVAVTLLLGACMIAAVAPASAHSGSWSGQFVVAGPVGAQSFGTAFWETTTPGNNLISSVVTIAPTHSDGRHRIRVQRSSGTPGTVEIGIRFRIGSGQSETFVSTNGVWEGTIPRNADKMAVFGRPPRTSGTPPTPDYVGAGASVGWSAAVIAHL